MKGKFSWKGLLALNNKLARIDWNWELVSIKLSMDWIVSLVMN